MSGFLFYNIMDPILCILIIWFAIGIIALHVVIFLFIRDLIIQAKNKKKYKSELDNIFRQ